MIGIAISGKAASGKSSFARELHRQLPSSTITPFAGALKEEVYELFGLLKTDPGGREKLIEYGEERRNECADYWIDRVAVKVEAARAEGLTPIIDDLRFQRELHWCLDNAFYVVRVDAPWSDRVERLAAQNLDTSIASSSHPGESDLDGCGDLFDFRFQNGGPLRCCLCCVARRVIAHTFGLEYDKSYWSKSVCP